VTRVTSVLLACACTSFAAAAPAGAATAPARFSVTVTGLLRTHWNQEFSYVLDECDFVSQLRGHKVVAFHSRRPTVITIGKRGFRLTLKTIAGTIAGDSGSGATVSEECGQVTPTEGIALSGGFQQARIELSQTAEGTVRLGTLRPEVSDSTPWAPVVFGAARPPLERALGSYDVRKLANPRVRRIVVSGRYGDVVRLAGDALGLLGLEVSWTVTLNRLRK
jgi:hypothetical protein